MSIILHYPGAISGPLPPSDLHTHSCCNRLPPGSLPPAQTLSFPLPTPLRFFCPHDTIPRLCFPSPPSTSFPFAFSPSLSIATHLAPLTTLLLSSVLLLLLHLQPSFSGLANPDPPAASHETQVKPGGVDRIPSLVTICYFCHLLIFYCLPHPSIPFRSSAPCYAMNGRNSSGRAISLLNDDSTHCARSPGTNNGSAWDVAISPKTSNIQSLPSRARPPTPDLMRSSSSSSQQTIDSPSPKTPAFMSEQRPSLVHFAVLTSRSHVSRKPPESSNMRPLTSPRQTLSSVSPFADNADAQPQAAREASPPTSPAATSPTLSVKQVLKNFPCQLALEYGCEETFTTSGHASRHAKKHTGEKKVACPRCPKRFARKDNMKQHLKTHESCRAVDKNAEDGDGDGLVPSPRSHKLRSKSNKRAGSPMLRVETDETARPAAKTESPSPDSADVSRHPGHQARPPQRRARPSTLPSPHHAPSAYPTSALTPGLDALVIAADATLREESMNLDRFR